MKPRFFKTPATFRAWLAKHHEEETELWVGYYKVGAGRQSITWPESVDEALCFGWIDGIRKSLDERSYVIRFTPRKPRSVWSAVNVKRATALIAAGQMQPAGLKAFEERREDRSRIYSYEQTSHKLDEQHERHFQANEKAWAFFQAQAPWYRRTASWWVISAKQEATRLKRLKQLIADSAAGVRIASLRREKLE